MKSIFQKRLLALLTILVPLVAAPHARADIFESENGDVADGNELLKEGKVALALEKYEAAAKALPGRAGVHLNRGLALARSGEAQLAQAMTAFQVASEEEGDDRLKSRAAYNLGNGFFRSQDYDKAIELYQKSLMLAPGNKDVAWNLELARQKKKEKEEQQKQDQQNQDQQNQDQQNQDQQDQDQQNQDQDQQDQDQQDTDSENQNDQEKEPDKQDQQDQEKQEDEQEPEAPPQPKTRQEMEQVLDSLDDQQKDLMKQMAKRKGAMVPAGRVKDW